MNNMYMHDRRTIQMQWAECAGQDLLTTYEKSSFDNYALTSQVRIDKKNVSSYNETDNYKEYSSLTNEDNPSQIHHSIVLFYLQMSFHQP